MSKYFDKELTFCHYLLFTRCLFKKKFQIIHWCPKLSIVSNERSFVNIKMSTYYQEHSAFRKLELFLMKSQVALDTSRSTVLRNLSSVFWISSKQKRYIFFLSGRSLIGQLEQIFVYKNTFIWWNFWCNIYIIYHTSHK